MKCERCASEMKWVGSMITGSLVCPHCSCCEGPLSSIRIGHIEFLLEEGVIVERNVGYEARCVCCDEYTWLYVDPSEIDEDYRHYCGGSPRCCP
jgi:hypothetical protein